MKIRVALSVLVAVAASAPATATTVRQLSLAEMCGRADRVFRGVVVQAQPDTVETARGRLPVVTYRVRVQESFKGKFREDRGERYVDMRFLSDAALRRNERTRMQVPGLPRLRVGETYLLLTTRPGRLGLEAPIGLGQGVFHLRAGAMGEVAVNQMDNRHLFRGMAQESPGPVAYGRLAERIRGLVGVGAR